MVSIICFFSLFYSPLDIEQPMATAKVGYIQHNVLVEAHEKSWFHLKSANAAQ